MASDPSSAPLVSEWSPRINSEPLQQGDIFKWEAPPEDSPWKRYGVIVTADCDFAQNKHREIVSYCPILPLKEFLEIFWIPEDLRRASASLRKRVAERLTALRQAGRPEFDLPINPELLLGWLERRGPEGIADDVGIRPGKDRESVVAELSLLASIARENPNCDARAGLESLARAKLNIPSPSSAELENRVKRIWKDYQGKFRSLPGDLFFLNELGDECAGGFLVYLRRVAELVPDAIATRPAERRTRPATRISRLRPPFRYRLTQQLASMFADIGLPREYEDRSADTIANLALSLRIDLA
jgi:hypothetical protein